MIVKRNCSHVVRKRNRFTYSCVGSVIVALATLQMVTLAAEHSIPRVTGLRGATPGVTTKAELLANEHWGQPRKIREDTGGKEYLLYTIGRFQVAATVSDGAVQSLDIRLPAGTSVAVAQEGFSLGKRDTDAEIPREAEIGLAVPHNWAPHHYPERCAVVYTSPGAAPPEAAMVRLYAYVVTRDVPTCTTSQESEAACLKGIDRLKEMRLDEALAEFAEAIRHDPEHYCPYLYRSECYLRQGKNDAALAAIRHAIGLNEKEAFCHARLAHVLNQKLDRAGALAAANRAIELDAECSYGYAQRAFAYDKLGKHSQSLADHNRVIQLTPEDFSAYVARGDFLTFRGDYRGALKDAEKAVELAPQQALPYCLRAFCRGNLRDVRGALADANKAIELQPDYAHAYEVRAKAYAEMRDYRRAQADRRTAARLRGE